MQLHTKHPIREFIQRLMLLTLALLLPFIAGAPARRVLAVSDHIVYMPLVLSNSNFGNGPTLAGCPVLPADNIWNTPVDGPNIPLASHSADYVASIGVNEYFHADFGSGTWNGGPIGIPFAVVPGKQAGVKITFKYADESDPGPGGMYPIPSNPPIEGGPNSPPNSDRHILLLDKDHCILYEIYNANPQTNGIWKAGSGAIYDLRSQTLRPRGWTSADAAGLAILPGLVKYDEVASGEIKHAIRFTAPVTNPSFYVWPARHIASDEDPNPALPPMGQRFRLKASFDISRFSPDVQVILKAMKKYGLILADNGSSWYLSGAPDERWDNDTLHELDQMLSGQDMEAVDTSSLMIDPDSGQARQP